MPYGCLVLWFIDKQQRLYDTFIGCVVSELESVPEAFTLRKIPNKNYAVFVYSGTSTNYIEFIKAVYYDWFPNSGYEYNGDDFSYIHFHKTSPEKVDMTLPEHERIRYIWELIEISSYISGMKLSRIQVRKVAWITIIWTIISVVKFLISYGAFVEYGFDDQIDLMIPLKASIITGMMAGILGGGSIVLLWEKWLRSKPYGWAIRSTLISYSVIFIIIAFVTTTFFQTQLLDLPFYHAEVLMNVIQRMISPNTLIPFISWLAVAALTVIALLVNDKYGPGVFRKFLLGHYFNPKREERIFMFLDLRSSTTIAEELGEERYFSFLREVFKFATSAILRNEGEIYQYVGDEIVISWETEKGRKNAHCIQCFFDIQELLNKKKRYFSNAYGHQPEFKAGIHFGHVMAGEIGIVKREIAFSGDVLNTTARIQSKCNELGVNILTSKATIDLLGPINQFKPEEVGAIELRGKKEMVTLFTI